MIFHVFVDVCTHVRVLMTRTDEVFYQISQRATCINVLRYSYTFPFRVNRNWKYYSWKTFYHEIKTWWETAKYCYSPNLRRNVFLLGYQSDSPCVFEILKLQLLMIKRLNLRGINMLHLNTTSFTSLSVVCIRRTTHCQTFYLFFFPVHHSIIRFHESFGFSQTCFFVSLWTISLCTELTLHNLFNTEVLPCFKGLCVVLVFRLTERIPCLRSANVPTSWRF